MPANWTADLLLLVGIAWFALGALIIIERARHDRWLRQLARLRDRLIDSSDSTLGQIAADVSAAQFEQLVLDGLPRHVERATAQALLEGTRRNVAVADCMWPNAGRCLGSHPGCAGARLGTDRNRLLHPRRDAADRRSAACAGRAAVVRPARRSTVRRPADSRAGRWCSCALASGCRLQRPVG